MKRLYFFALFCSMQIASAAQAQAVSDVDISIISNSLRYFHGLRQEKPVTVGVLYVSQTPGSEAAAKEYLTLFQKSKAAEKAGLTAELVSMDELANNNHISMLYVASELLNKADLVRKLAQKKHLFTFSSDKNCVEVKSCILSIQGTPTVEILMNEQTLRDLGFEMDAAYRLMAKRV